MIAFILYNENNGKFKV